MPMKDKLKILKPKVIQHEVASKPMIEEVYFSFVSMMNHLCKQFQKFPRIENLLYKRMKWPSTVP